MKVAELEGAQIGDLRILSRTGSNSEGRALWSVVCKCGESFCATSKQINSAKTICPGCRRVSRYDDLVSRIKKQIGIRFETGCWIWQGKTNDSGYGMTKIAGKEVRAHRAMYFAVNPNAEDSLSVLHRCDTPACVNPEHLFLGTQADNMRDMHMKGRFKGGAKIGNKNSVGNTGWTKGGIVKILGRVPASKFCDEVADDAKKLDTRQTQQ